MYRYFEDYHVTLLARRVYQGPYGLSFREEISCAYLWRIVVFNVFDIFYQKHLYKTRFSRSDV